MSAAVRTTCPYCGVGCGILATPATGRSGADGPAVNGPAIAGDPDHPANHGRLCSKGSALGDTLSLDGRLLVPRILGRDTGWSEALQYVAQGFNRVIERHGPDAVAFYVSGQLLTEDYYVANKLMKGYIGSANIDTNSRLCMSSAVAAHKRAFGEDVVPVSYEDLELADLIVLVGSNTAWCHPVVFQRIVAAKARRPEVKIVVIDPRATSTCEGADLHLPLKAGTDVWLFNGLLDYLHQHGIENRAFIDAHTADAERALTVAQNTAGGTAAVARLCGLELSAIEEFYRLFARTQRVVTLFSQGVNQSSSGTDKANGIINCHLLTGRIGRPGAGPFSITGQPNAMGGREVGGLANMLAAHLEIENPEHRRIVQNFWRSPRMAERPGLKAVDLFEAMHAGKVRAVWIAGTNPVVSLPNADRARAALRRCDLVVVSDCVADTDTTGLAHVLLPAAAWGEKEGTVTNSERRISRQRVFLPAPGAAKPDWWIFAEAAKHMGFTHGFGYSSAHEVFVEHAKLSAEGNGGSRAFDIGALGDLDPAAYAALAPTRWPARAGDAHRADGAHRVDGAHRANEAHRVDEAHGIDGAHRADGVDDRLFADGRFFHADGRARFIATTPRPPAHAPDEEFPLVLNTGRTRDQWHTMTRTGKSARLMTHAPEPYVDMHPQDALLSGVRVGEFVRVITRWGSLVARLRTSGEMPRRMIFVPMHWSDVFSADARVGALVNPAVDPVSGEPEFKHTPARVASFVVAWQGFVLNRRPLALKDAAWWSVTRGENFLRYEMAGHRVFGNWSPWARGLLKAPPDADWLEYVDRSTGVYRAAYLVNDEIEGCVFISPRPDLPPRGWVSSLFAKPALDDRDRAALLIGQPADAAADAGAVVCSCFGVGRNTICSAIRDFGLRSPEQVGQRLRAGTNCGSCLPEIKAILNEQSAALSV
ncbi:MAG: molybdopterin-dependent oxidoreductase [Pseudomonadota bacterium]|nr:molybdopterin-dependent oxidoreductase [Pseudomonadota bacterium]